MPSIPTARSAISIRLPFDTPHQMAARASKIAADFFCALDPDLETGARVHMVAQELAENVLKYSTEGETHLELAIDNGPRGRLVRVTARNRTSAEKMSEVQQRVQELQQARDPIEVYDRLIRETAPRRGVSGLGLARISAEGGFRMTCAVEHGDLVVIALLELAEHAP
jgi:hypothetical protein